MISDGTKIRTHAIFPQLGGMSEGKVEDFKDLKSQIGGTSPMDYALEPHSAPRTGAVHRSVLQWDFPVVLSFCAP